MTLTFSQILEEKLNSRLHSHDVFYSGITDATCIFQLTLQGLHFKNLRSIGSYPQSDLPQDLEPYVLSNEQQQAVDFLNQQLAAHQRLGGCFTLTRLRRAYRYLAKKLHPDLGGSPELFRELHTQYKILLDFMTKIK